MRIRPIWAFPLAAVATTGILFTANAVTGSPKAAPTSPSQYSLADSGGGESTTAEDPTTAAEDGATTVSPTALSVQNDPSLGKIVVDGKGWTLYRFDKDTANPSASNCEGDCAKAWPPVKASDDVQLEGVDQSLVSKVTRADGSEQLTLGGWPLYRYAKDAQPGDTNGQGVGGTWFASNPTGKKAQANAANAPAAPKATPKPKATTPPQNSGGSSNNWKGWTILKAKQDPKLGWVVTDAKGWVLYRFDKDTAKPPVSNCLGACAKTWPPVKATAKIKVVGVPKKLVSSIMRKDGICQLTLNGWALYRYSKDVNPGDTNGQGVGGIWWAVTPQGGKAMAAATQGDDSGGDDGYDSGYSGGY